MALHPIIRDEFIHNLRLLIRHGFPKGLPLESLKLAYSTNHPDCTVPTPKSISPEYDDWPTVFNTSENFKEWFHMDISNSIIFVLPKPEPDLFALSQLINNDNYIMMKAILEQKPKTIEQGSSAVTAAADPSQSNLASLPTPTPIILDASQHQQNVEDVDKDDNQSVQSLTGEKNLDSDLTTSRNEREGIVKIRPMKEILEPEPCDEFIILEEILGEEAGSSSSSSSPSPTSKVTPTTKVAPPPPNPVDTSVTKSTSQNNGEKRKIQAKNEKSTPALARNSTNSVPVAGPSNVLKPVPISRKRPSKELKPRNANTSVTKSANKPPPFKKPGKERLESLLDISISTKDVEKYRRKSEESPKRKQKMPALLETPRTPLPERVVQLGNVSPRRPSIREKRFNSRSQRTVQSEDVDLRHEKRVVAELLELFTPEHCQLCDKNFRIKGHAANHYTCVGHRNKVQIYLDESGANLTTPDDDALQYNGYLTHEEEQDLRSDPHPQPEPHAYPVPRDPNTLHPYDARHNLDSRRDYTGTADMDYQSQEWQGPLDSRARSWDDGRSWSWQRECDDTWCKAYKLFYSQDLSWCEHRPDYPHWIPDKLMEIGQKLRAYEYQTPHEFARQLARVLSYLRKLPVLPAHQGYEQLQRIEHIFKVKLPHLIRKYEAEAEQGQLAITHI